MAGALFGAGHLATKKVRGLNKWRSGIMVGLGLNVLDSLLIAFAPDNVKSLFGLAGDEPDLYGPSLSDYVSVDDYMSVGNAPPIEDQIALADYVSVGDDLDAEGLEQELGSVEQDLGMLEQELGSDLYQELGVEADLGSDFADRRLGGVRRSAMRGPIGHKRALAPVPNRSFTRPVRSFDKPTALYTGVFSGGFGS